MKKIPVALKIDDGCPVIHLYYFHDEDPLKRTHGDRHPLVKTVPNSFLTHFCDLTDKYGIKGKQSVVPLPAGENPYESEEGKEWINIVNARLKGKFSFCCEMLTHWKTWDIKNKSIFPKLNRSGRRSKIRKH